MNAKLKKLQLYLALNRLCGLQTTDVEYLSQYEGDLATLLSSSVQVLAKLGFTSQSIAQLKKLDWLMIEAELRWLEHPRHHIVTLADDNYPALLRTISAPPIVLFVYGDVNCLQQTQLAIVGSRNPTPAGRETAFQFAKYLVQCGLVINSGLAIGIDAASHRGALQAGHTIGVMGTSIDQIYPHRHRDLMEQIAANGAVISEFPLNTPAKRENFPRRNRIISGLSIGTLVVEAALRSGSLVTARLAGEQGREVFAIPASIHNPLARGCHELIRNGAKLVETAQDILEELKISANVNKQVANSAMDGSECVRKQENLDADSKKLLSCVDFSVTAVDTLIARTGFTAEVIASMLLILELDGYVARVTGGYCRLHRN